MTTSASRRQSDSTQQHLTVSKLIDSVNAASLIAEVLLAAAVFGGITYCACVLGSLRSMNFFSLRAPTETSWHPDSSFYCNALRDLNPNLPDQFSVDLIANAAPTATAHNAAVALYKDVANSRPTTNAVNTLVAAYPCPAS